ncbi:hypothetical protein GUITHDRAFT_104512 [Guillardia theta CCMP2712]|uniref:Uncharacterized protein n=1 Tax=Guillardia theta (strain CCMP2712) TaxID=905079 RepID=L1JMX8_GUITC|nr:hypothetical protein GUITHDRAFT_104512 [Guillardia theta CCMP2712]EKX49550.1 hypothetical protein GUITHDRAFT_104512 [Guillardia theta CCMP2712]|eukprot:XP_005836530.1 hypothetical protein GUITHDRAFT_104512 [Guillardia theta CCMP2712]
MSGDDARVADDIGAEPTVQGKENGMSEFIQQYYDDDAVDIIGRPLKQMMELRIKAQEDQDAAFQQGVGYPTKGVEVADDRASCYLKLFILGLIVSIVALGTCGILCIASNGEGPTCGSGLGAGIAMTVIAFVLAGRGAIFLRKYERIVKRSLRGPIYRST